MINATNGEALWLHQDDDDIPMYLPVCFPQGGIAGEFGDHMCKGMGYG